MWAFVRAVERHYPPDANAWPVAANRRAYDELCEALRPSRPRNVTSADEECALDFPMRKVPIRRYECGTVPEQPSVVVLYLHGGGFVVGGLESYDDICAEICARTGLGTVAVDYRLAPEHAYPAALDDVEGAYRALLQAGWRVLAVGDSAGGTLAAALSYRLARVGVPQAIGQVLIYPALGPAQNRGSYLRWAHAPMLRAADCAHYIDLYRGESVSAQADDPEFLPLLASDASGQPPTWVVSADVDPLRDDGRDYVAKLVAHGVSAEWRNEPGLVHGYLRARGMSQRAAASFDAIVDAIQKLALRLG